MTDKELFEKTEKTFNLKKNNKVKEVFNKGNFKNILNEVITTKAPGADIKQTAGGVLSRVAAAIPGTRGHRMRSAEARKLEAQAKKAEIDARAAQQRQMQGKQIPGKQIKRQKDLDLKPGDVVMVNTKKSGKKQAIIKEIRPDKTVQLALRNGPVYSTSIRDIIGKVQTL